MEPAREWWEKQLEEAILGKHVRRVPRGSALVEIAIVLARVSLILVLMA